jgi:hypothetical protein
MVILVVEFGDELRTIGNYQGWLSVRSILRVKFFHYPHPLQADTLFNSGAVVCHFDRLNSCLLILSTMNSWGLV